MFSQGIRNRVAFWTTLSGSMALGVTASLTKNPAQPNDLFQEMQKELISTQVAVRARNGAGVFTPAVTTLLTKTRKLTKPSELVQPMRATKETSATQLGELAQQKEAMRKIAVIHGRPGQVDGRPGQVARHFRHGRHRGHGVVPPRAYVVNCSCFWHV